MTKFLVKVEEGHNLPLHVIEAHSYEVNNGLIEFINEKLYVIHAFNIDKVIYIKVER